MNASIQTSKLIEKQVYLPSFLPVREKIRSDSKTLVWTNGCFDLLHGGHVVYLENAKQCGDYLIVGVNSDASFRRLKKARLQPLNHEHNRMIVLAALQVVDFVLLFEDISPAMCLKKIQPDFYIKGEDYTLETIDQNEKQIIENYGGIIKFCRGIPELSTSKLLQKIVGLYQHNQTKP